jgi:CheY-like chemotaxis protein
MERLFSDYTRMVTASNNVIQGTGLGLPITKSLITLMEGSISVESEPGTGSAFTVKLPQTFVTDAAIGPEVVQNLQRFQFIDHKRREQSRLARLHLPYARVLVVDDVPTNLDVAKGMLKPYGMRIDCLTSGRQAIEAIHAEQVRYNAVFMDHMMPELDGMETTRIIREEIGSEYARTVPIIALTANALVGNEAMFLSKGFQAFLTKPIDVVRLDAVIRQWVRDKTRVETLLHESDDAGPPENAAADFPLRVEGIDLHRGLARFGNDKDSFLHVLHSYAVNTRPLLEAARGVNQTNLADYAVIVHGIKGSSRGIGADMVGDRAEALEHAAKGGNYAFVTANNAALIEAAEGLIDDLDAMLRQLAKPKPKQDRLARELLDRLLVACETYDMDGVDAAMAELASCEYGADNGLAAWLKKNVEQMNFTLIKEKLSALQADAEGEHGRRPS